MLHNLKKISVSLKALKKINLKNAHKVLDQQLRLLSLLNVPSRVVGRLKQRYSCANKKVTAVKNAELIDGDAVILSSSRQRQNHKAFSYMSRSKLILH